MKTHLVLSLLAGLVAALLYFIDTTQEARWGDDPESIALLEIITAPKKQVSASVQAASPSIAGETEAVNALLDQLRPDDTYVHTPTTPVSPQPPQPPVQPAAESKVVSDQPAKDPFDPDAFLAWAKTVELIHSVKKAAASALLSNLVDANTKSKIIDVIKQPVGGDLSKFKHLPDTVIESVRNQIRVLHKAALQVYFLAKNAQNLKLWRWQLATVDDTAQFLPNRRVAHARVFLHFAKNYGPYLASSGATINVSDAEWASREVDATKPFVVYPKSKQTMVGLAQAGTCFVAVALASWLVVALCVSLSRFVRSRVFHVNTPRFIASLFLLLFLIALLFPPTWRGGPYPIFRFQLIFAIHGSPIAAGAWAVELLGLSALGVAAFLWAKFAPNKPESKKTFLDDVQGLSGTLIVNGYRRIATKRSCAPSEKTSDAKIIEIYARVCAGFRRVANERGEKLPAAKINNIVLFFLQLFEVMGDAMMEPHLEHELEKYRKEGLRDEYNQDLDLS